MSKSNHEILVASLTYEELVTLEDELLIRLDELDGEVASLQGQIDEIWSEHAWYDEQTGDYNLTGNAYYYEEKLQDAMAEAEEQLVLANDQLYDVHSRMGKFGV